MYIAEIGFRGKLFMGVLHITQSTMTMQRMVVNGGTGHALTVLWMGRCVSLLLWFSVPRLFSRLSGASTSTVRGKTLFSSRFDSVQFIAKSRQNCTYRHIRLTSSHCKNWCQLGTHVSRPSFSPTKIPINKVQFWLSRRNTVEKLIWPENFSQKLLHLQNCLPNLNFQFNFFRLFEWFWLLILINCRNLGKFSLNVAGVNILRSNQEPPVTECYRKEWRKVIAAL